MIWLFGLALLAVPGNPLATATIETVTIETVAVEVPGGHGFGKQRAGDGIRTHDNDVGNVVLYQLSYTRLHDLPPASRGWPTSLGSTDYRGTPLLDKVIWGLGGIPDPLLGSL